MLQKDVADPLTRLKKFSVCRGGEFYRVLLAHSDLCNSIPKNTVTGWFTYSGKKHAAHHPVPTATFNTGYKKGYNERLRHSTGRPTLLAGCEDVLEEFAAQLKQQCLLSGVRSAGISVNLYTMRYMLMPLLLEAGKGELLRPHLTGEVAVNRRLFTCSSTWLRTILRKYLGWSWRASTKAAQSTPDNELELTRDMLQPIAVLCRAYEIPPERVFMANETFTYLHPDSRCVRT